MSVEEQRLSEMLHRFAPEPPRPVTVEDIAIRLANQAAPQRRARRGQDRAGYPQQGRDGHTAVLHRPRRPRLRWAPALAAASVIAVVGASAGIGVALTSHHGKPTPPAGGSLTSVPGDTSPGTTSPTTGATITHPPEPHIPVANGMWNATLIDREALTSDTLVGSGTFLYGVTNGYLIKFDPASGDILGQVNIPSSGPAVNRPVVAGNTVWVVWSGGNSNITLHGFNALTLNPEGNISVSGGGQTPAATEGVVAAGPGGDLSVAAGNTVAVVNPADGSVIRRMTAPGNVVSVAVSPDGTGIYAGFVSGGNFGLAKFDAASGTRQGVSTMSGSQAGYLIATSGGVWFTTGTQMLQRVWFAPGGDLSGAHLLTGGEDGGLDSIPTYANGVVWVGGIQSLDCLDPATGKILGASVIPADAGLPEHFGSVAYVSGHVYATYQDPHARLEGIAAVTPPSTCAG